jgi:hypothetical protein
MICGRPSRLLLTGALRRATRQESSRLSHERDSSGAGKRHCQRQSQRKSDLLSLRPHVLLAESATKPCIYKDIRPGRRARTRSLKHSQTQPNTASPEFSDTPKFKRSGGIYQHFLGHCSRSIANAEALAQLRAKRVLSQAGVDGTADARGRDFAGC